MSRLGFQVGSCYIFKALTRTMAATFLLAMLHHAASSWIILDHHVTGYSWLRNLIFSMGSDWRRDCFKALSGSLCPKGSKGTSTKRPWALFLDKDLFSPVYESSSPTFFLVQAATKTARKKTRRTIFEWMNTWKLTNQRCMGWCIELGKTSVFFFAEISFGPKCPKHSPTESQKDANQT